MLVVVVCFGLWRSFVVAGGLDEKEKLTGQETC